MWKTIGVISTIAFTIIIASVGYGKLYANQSNTSKQVDEVKIEVKEVRKDVTENTAVSREQAVVLERAVKIIDKLEIRIEQWVK